MGERISIPVGDQWWRDAVVYQIYPRSFADGNGDGVGDLRGIIDHLDYIAGLGVDALWLSPVMVSPQADHGYDVADYRAIDPLFGSLADMDELIAAAHERGLRVTLDFVPNHTSEEHVWFKEALASPPGSPARARYHFRPGRGDDHSLPPNNWRSVFGGPSWTRVPDDATNPDGPATEWYYHLFASEQPDLNWENPEVLPEFCDVIRFWLARGVDGFRIDVSDGLMKDRTFPDTANGEPIIPKDDASGVHAIYRALRSVFDEFAGDRMAVIETGATQDIVALFLRPDEMHLAFNFAFTRANWHVTDVQAAIDSALRANLAVGAPTTWVTDNHDMPRSVTRYGSSAQLEGAYVPGTLATATVGTVDTELGRRRHRAMSLLLLALPGTAYLYNGQELGLPNVDDLPEDVLQDPVWDRSGHTERGRDGCRVPMPWSGDQPPFGFGANPATWLPMPADWADLSVAAQDGDEASMLSLYRRAVGLRRTLAAARRGGIAWLDGVPAGLLALRVGPADGAGVVVLVNFAPDPVVLPAELAARPVLLASDPTVAVGSPVDTLEPATSVWLLA